LAVGDSLARLKRAFAAETEVEHQRIAEWSLSFKDQSLVIWIEDPWGDLSSAPEAARIKANMNKPLQLRGAQDVIESGCIGILNRNAASAEITFTLHGEPSVVSAVQVRAIKSVTAGDGKLVYDALMRLNRDTPVVVLPNSVSYLWLTIDFS